MNSFAENRKSNFKSKDIFEFENVRNRRQKFHVEIRKQQREERWSKRRYLDTPCDNEQDFDNLQPEKLTALVAGVMSDQFEEQIRSMTEFRKILSRNNAPVQQIIDTGVIPRFVLFLRTFNPDLQYEAAWALTNISAGTQEQTVTVVSAGAVPLLIELIENPRDDIKEQAIWALSNIAGESPTMCDYILDQDVLVPLSTIFIKGQDNFSLLRTAAWLFSNICRNIKKSPSMLDTVFFPGLRIVAKAIHTDDKEALTDICWSLSFLTDGLEDIKQIQVVIDLDICPRVVGLLAHHPSEDMRTALLRTVGTIAMGTRVCTQTLIDCGALSALKPFLNSPHTKIRKETCWVLSNIAAGSIDQVDALLHADLAPEIIRLLATDPDYRVRKEACWVIHNVTQRGLKKPSLVQCVVEYGVIQPLCEILQVRENKLISIALGALKNIIAVGEQKENTDDKNVNQYALLVEEYGGMDLIYKLQQHENEEIYKQAYKLIDMYFNAEEEEVLQPSTFSFQAESFDF